MRVITKAVIQIATSQVLEIESYEYNGPVALCKGGGSSTTVTVDKAYNKRMAAIAEAQQVMAQEYFDFWESDYKPMEKAQIESNMNLIEFQEGAEKTKLEAEALLIPKQADVAEGILDVQDEYGGDIMTSYYKQALKGVDVNHQAQMARNDVAQTFGGAQDSLNRDLSRYGVIPGSNKWVNAQQNLGLQRAKATASGMTSARQAAENTNFSRVSGAANSLQAGIAGVG